MVNPYRFYTYAYVREDNTPYYIGKGQGDRVYKKSKGEVNPPKDKSRIIFLKQNLLEENAFKHEKYMIAVFGRIDLGTGILHNRTDGGEGGSGAIRNEEYKRKHSEAKKGENNPNYGKSPSKETKKKMSETKKGKLHTEETRRKCSEVKRGKNNPNYGKSPSKETRIKQSIKMKGKNNVNYGKKWWNDGCGNTKFAIECPGESWFPGRGKLKNKL